MTRARLLARLREAGTALSIRALAADVGLHPNSVREQLDRLVESGEVRVARSEPAGRGRPAHRYTASPVADPAAPFRELARVLADELAADPHPSTRAVAAGERWGRSLVEPSSTGRGAAAVHPSSARAGGAVAPFLEARERLVDLLAVSGFAPEVAEAPDTIRLHRCPFGALAIEHGEVVCGVHLGLMRGALAELGAPLDGVRLDPLVEPDLCLAHLGGSDDPGRVDSPPPIPTERRP